MLLQLLLLLNLIAFICAAVSNLLWAWESAESYRRRSDTYEPKPWRERQRSYALAYGCAFISTVILSFLDFSILLELK